MARWGGVGRGLVSWNPKSLNRSAASKHGMGRSERGSLQEALKPMETEANSRLRLPVADSFEVYVAQLAKLVQPLRWIPQPGCTVLEGVRLRNTFVIRLLGRAKGADSGQGASPYGGWGPYSLWYTEPWGS